MLTERDDAPVGPSAVNGVRFNSKRGDLNERSATRYCPDYHQHLGFGAASDVSACGLIGCIVDVVCPARDGT